MSNRRFNQFYGTLHNKPVQIDCSFVVASADAAGKGVTGLVGAGIQNVFMHTSASPAAGSPNPASGYIYVQLQDSYYGYYLGDYQIFSPNSGSNVVVTAAGAALTVGKVYVISVLGTTTAADWVTLGVPVGTTPAVGVAFVAAVTGAGVGSGQVQLPKATGSQIGTIEVVGAPSLTVSSKGAQVQGQTSGAYLILQCLGPTNSTTTTQIASAPVDGSVINLGFLLNNGKILNKGD